MSKSKNPRPIYEVIRGLMDQHGMSIRGLASRTATPRSTLQAIMHGKRTLSERVGVKLAKALGVGRHELLNAQTDWLLWSEGDEFQKEYDQIKGPE